MANGDQEIGNVEAVNAALEKQLKFLEKKRRLEGETLTSLQREEVALQARDRLYVRIEDILDASEEKYKKIIERTQDTLDLEKRRGDLTEDYYKKYSQLLSDLTEARANSDAAAVDAVNKQLKDLQKVERQNRKNIETYKKGAKAVEGMVDAMAGLVGLTDDAGSGVQAMVETLISGKKGALELGKALGSSIGKYANFFNLAGNAAAKAAEHFVNVNNAVTDFARVAGRTGEFTEAMLSANDRFRALGVSLEEAAQANESLYRNFTRFSNLARGERENLIGLTSTLANLNISTDTTARSLNFLTQELGMTTKEARVQLKGLNEEITTLGIVPEEFTSALVALSPQLSDFGARGPRIMLEFAKSAKQMGFEIGEAGSKLFSASNQMSNFTGAAKVASDLAILLGGNYVNAFDLTMAAAEGPQAQFELLQRAVQASGKSLQDMKFFESSFAKGIFDGTFTSGQTKALLSGGAFAKDDAALTTKLGEQITEKMSVEQMSIRTISMGEGMKLAMEAVGSTIAKEIAKAMGLTLTEATNKASETASKVADEASGDSGVEWGSIAAGITAAISVGKLKPVRALLGKGLSFGKGMFSKMGGMGKTLMGGLGSRILFGKGGIKPNISSRDVMGGLGKAGKATKGMKMPKLGGRVGAALKIAGIGATLFGSGDALAAPSSRSRSPNDFAPVDLKNTGASADFIEGGAGQSQLNTAGDIGSFFLPVIGTALKIGAEMGVSALDLAPGQLREGALPLQQRSMGATGPKKYTLDSFKNDPRFASQMGAGQSATSRLTQGDVEVAMTNALAKSEGNTQPIQVDLYLDRIGQEKIATKTIKQIDKRYSLTSTPSPVRGGLIY